jgi:hypothetical protein
MSACDPEADMPVTPLAETKIAKSSYPFWGSGLTCPIVSRPLTIRVSAGVAASLRDRAAAFEKTESELGSDLLEAIVRDDLYNAVLDHE